MPLFPVHLLYRRMSAAVPTTRATSERVAELTEALTEIRQRVAAASAKAAKPTGKPVLVAVSKYKPAGDLLACYDEDQRDFGENYVQELVDKAAQVRHGLRCPRAAMLTAMCASSFPRISDGTSSEPCSLTKPRSSLVRPASTPRTHTAY